MGLRIAGRKNLRHLPLERIGTQRIDHDRDRRPDRDNPHIAFGHSRFQPELFGVFHLEQRLPRGGQFPDLNLLLRDDAIERRFHDGVAQLRENSLASGFGDPQPARGILQLLLGYRILPVEVFHPGLVCVGIVELCRHPG